ncbi:hypothetical protein [Methanobrevibacter sp. DSM 116169]|uniref:glycosyltransferase family 39 protein n=1 Tax=Methanobrevibacter sp. DSM 116169 TaxID=3242727 RepID=UPI0038FCCC43
MEFKKEISKNNTGMFLFGLSLIFLFIMTYVGITKIGIWSDELYTFAILQYPISEMIELISQDVHPPLYYLIYKFLLKIGELIGFSTINDMIIIGKITSLIPFYLLIGLAITKIKKNFGLLTMGIFSLCIITMPRFMLFGVELRMYSWGLFFVTASLIYLYEIIKSTDQKSNLKKWIILTILTICSIYTHYFSAIASFSLYCLFLIYILYQRKDLLKYWFLSGIISAIAFIPWATFLLKNFLRVSDSYWIAPITFERIIGYVYYILSPANIPVNANEIVYPTILGTLLLIGIIILIVYYLKNKKDLEGNFAIFAILSLILVFIIGIVASYTTRPIFHVRYCIPILGSFWLGISILLSKVYIKKEIFIPILAIILIVGVVGTNDFINIQEKEFEETQNLTKDFDVVVGSESVIFFNSYNVYRLLTPYYFSDDYNLIWESGDSGLDIENALQDPGIQNRINHGSKVFFVDKANYGYQQCIDHGLKLEKKYYYKHDNITIYEVQL